MTKRKAQHNDYNDPPPQRKRIKSSPSPRFIQCGHFRLNLSGSPPPRPARSQRFNKRKLSQVSRTEPSDGPSTKRRKTTPRDSEGYNRDSSPTDSPVESDFETSAYDSSSRPPELISSDVEHPPSEGDDATDVEAWQDREDLAREDSSGEESLSLKAWAEQQGLLREDSPGEESSGEESQGLKAWPDREDPPREDFSGVEPWPDREDPPREDFPGVEPWPDREDPPREDFSGVEPWPGLSDSPPREPDPVWAFYDRLFRNSHRAAMIREEERRNGQERIQPRRRAQLPSPAPSNGGTGGSHPTSTGPLPASHTAPESPASPTEHHRRRLSSSPDETNRPSRQSQRRRRQPRRNSRHNQGQPRKKPSPADVEDFLNSRRASRRNVECTLWQLDDKGTARLVAVAHGR